MKVAALDEVHVTQATADEEGVTVVSAHGERYAWGSVLGPLPIPL